MSLKRAEGAIRQVMLRNRTIPSRNIGWQDLRRVGGEIPRGSSWKSSVPGTCGTPNRMVLPCVQVLLQVIANQIPAVYSVLKALGCPGLRAKRDHNVAVICDRALDSVDVSNSC